MPGKKKNRNLCTAKVRKQDEFYTDRRDIEKELVHYTKSFQGKTIYCCADNPPRVHSGASSTRTSSALA